MATLRTLGNGDRGYFLDIACVPDSTFKTELDALIAAGTTPVGKLVTLTFAVNYEVTSAAEDAIPDGEVLSWDKVNGSYKLGVRLFHYTDQNSASHQPTCIKTLSYEGTIALQDSVIIYNSDYDSVDDGGTGGFGAVIAKNTTNVTVDVLF